MTRGQAYKEECREEDQGDADYMNDDIDAVVMVCTILDSQEVSRGKRRG